MKSWISDDSGIFSPMFTIGHIKIGENILESSETEFMNLPPYVIDVDNIAEIRLELSITVLEKKTEQNCRFKKVTFVNFIMLH